MAVLTRVGLFQQRFPSPTLCIITVADRRSTHSTGTLSLTNGGPAGAIWVYLGTCVGMSTVVISMAELASMYLLSSLLTSPW